MIGLAFSALAVGLAASAGALALSTAFFPLILFGGMGMLMFGGFLSFGLLLPQFILLVSHDT